MLRSKNNFPHPLSEAEESSCHHQVNLIAVKAIDSAAAFFGPV